MRVIYLDGCGDTFSVSRVVSLVLEEVAPATLTFIEDEETRNRATLFYQRVVTEPTRPCAETLSAYVWNAVRPIIDGQSKKGKKNA